MITQFMDFICLTRYFFKFEIIYNQGYRLTRYFFKFEIIYNQGYQSLSNNFKYTILNIYILI